MNDRVYVLRQTIVKLTQLLGGKGVNVTQRGITAYVRPDKDGRPVQVNLPYIPDDADDELICAIQGFLDHEVAHILFTDFKVHLNLKDRLLKGMYNIVEDTRIERCMIQRFKGSAYNIDRTREFFLKKYTLPRTQEALQKGDIDGAIAVLTVPLIRGMAGQVVMREFMKDYSAPVADMYAKIKDLAPQIANCGSSQEAMDIAVEIMRRLRDGKAKMKPLEQPGEPQEGQEGQGKQDEQQAGGKPEQEPQEPEDDQDEATPQAASGEEQDEQQAGEEGTDEAKGEPSDEEQDEASGDGDGEEAEGQEEDAGAGGAGGAEQEQEDTTADGDGKGAEAEAEDDVRDSGGTPAPEEDDGTLKPAGQEKAKIQDGEELDVGAMSGAYLEALDKESANDFDSAVSRAVTDTSVEAAQDAEYLVYTTDKDVVEQLTVGRDYRDHMLKNVQDAVDHMVGPMQKDLERAISARSLATYTAGHRSGKLHTANLYRLCVVGPSGPDDRVFRRKHETRTKDVAVQLVVDGSGSMDGAKIHMATQAAYALAMTLERIGIACEVIVFTTGEIAGDRTLIEADEAKMGRQFNRVETLYMPVIKGFNERMGTEVRQRFGWLPNSDFSSANIDGESLMVAVRRLLERRETGKVMIVLSDGAPAGARGVQMLDGVRANSLVPHLRQVVKDITRAGVNVVGIGIMSDMVSKFYPKHFVLNDVKELPARVMRELRELILKD